MCNCLHAYQSRLGSLTKKVHDFVALALIELISMLNSLLSVQWLYINSMPIVRTEPSLQPLTIQWGEKSLKLDANQKELQKAICQALDATPSYQHLCQMAMAQVKCMRARCSKVTFLKPSENRTKETAERPENAGCLLRCVSGNVPYHYTPYLIQPI
jgi:hypothetical protein